MKAGWRNAAIADVCEVVNGGTPKTEVAAYWGGRHMWITPAEMGGRSNPYVGQTERQLTDAGLAAANLLPVRSVILSSRAPIGHLVINTVPMATNQGCKGLVPKRDVDHKYLFYYLASIVGLLNDLGAGATFKELSGGKLKEVPIPLPALTEQQSIVAVLDETFERLTTLSANVEKSLNNTRELFNSYRDSLFSSKGEDWVECTLDQLVEIKHGFAFKSEHFTLEGEYVLLTPGNFFEEGGYRDRGERQKYYRGDIPSGFILKKGDFLIAMTEQAAGLLGSSIIVPEENKFLHNQRLGLVQPKSDVQWSNAFFFHAFNTKNFRRAVHDSASGVKVRHTSPKKLGEIIVSYPKLRTEQEKIADRLDGLSAESERAMEFYRSKLELIAELKQSILQRAFAGELSQALQALKEAAE